MFKFLTILILTIASNLFSNTDYGEQLLQIKNHPFDYDLGVRFISNKQPNADVMICCHGYGGSNNISDFINSYRVSTDHLVSFNFPDYDIIQRNYAITESVYGTIDELLPLLYLIKLCVIDIGLKKINLYGFSAGGGAIINMLRVLNTFIYQPELEKIGITAQNRREIINAIENGLIILDCPLKSIDEIMTVQGSLPHLQLLASRYRQNEMTPIESLKYLKGLTLKIIVHFQQPDEILSNRDDQLYIDRLIEANKGETIISIGSDGGHNVHHQSLWNKYNEIIS